MEFGGTLFLWHLLTITMLFLQTDPDFDLDIRDDVQEECSKFGQLKHIFVDK
jgi:hypothetical protein